MVKDIVLAQTEEEAAQARSLWKLPPVPYNKLWWNVKDRTDKFPLLYSVCAHDERPDGNFLIAPDKIEAFIAEIDCILLLVPLPEDEDLRSLLLGLRELALGAKGSNSSIYGFAD